MSSRIARKLKTVQYRLRSLRTPQNLFDRMKNCIERVELSFGFAVRVFVLVESVLTSRYLRLNKGTCWPGEMPCRLFACVEWTRLQVALRRSLTLVWFKQSTPILQQSSTMADFTTQHHMLSSWIIWHQMDRSCCQCASICSSFTEHKGGTAAASGLESNCENDQRSEWRH